MTVRRVLFVGLLLTLGILAACQQTITLPTDQAEAFAAEVEPIVENSLVGLSSNDYAMHTRDFDEEMLKAVDPVTFPQLYDQIVGTLGAYQSHTLVSVQDQDRFRIVIYDAAFEREPHATVRFVFLGDDPDYHITGMWFDSALLRGQ